MKSLFTKDTDRFFVQVKVSPDNLKMFLDVIPKGTPAITRGDILNVLVEKFSTDGLDLGVIDDIAHGVSKGEEARDRRIKKAREPEPGHNGKLLLLVKKYTGKGEVREDDGKKRSLTELHIFDNIKKGQIIGRIYPPKPGKNGLNVLDQVIQAKEGEAPKFTLDKSLGLENTSEGFQKIVAQVDGYLAEESGALIVKDEFVVKGDLDFHYGNIDFIGKVTVTGEVLPGFGITAQKGILIKGGVRESRLVCKDGDIEIKGFAFGGDSGSIVCGKNVNVSVMQQLRAEVAGAIVVEKEAIDCNLRSQTTISMQKGRIIGGHAMVVCGLEAKEIGNSAGKETTVVMCSEIEVGSDFEKLLVNINNHEKAAKLLELHLGPFANNPSRVAFLKGAHKEKMEKLIAKLEDVKASRLKLLGKKKESLEGSRVTVSCRVNIQDVLHPGAVVVAGVDRFTPKDAIKGPKTIQFNAEKKVFDEVELTPLECAYAPVEGENKTN